VDKPEMVKVRLICAAEEMPGLLLVLETALEQAGCVPLITTTPKECTGTDAGQMMAHLTLLARGQEFYQRGVTYVQDRSEK
jgi:hypothetical protein